MPSLLLLAAVLAVALTPAALALTTPKNESDYHKTYEWRWKMEWNREENWVGGFPQDGQTVVFTQSFNDFGSFTCTSVKTCARGGVVAIKPPLGETQSVTRLKTLILPRGKVRFAGSTKFVFSGHKMNDSLPNSVIFDDHGPSGRDFTCARNWIISGNTTNPDFTTPGFNDTVIFPDNYLYQVEVPANSFVTAMTEPLGRTFTADPEQYQGSQVNRDSSLCPQPYGLDAALVHCPVNWKNGCNSLNPDHVKGVQASIDELKAELPYIRQAIAAAVESSTPLLSTVNVTGTVIFPMPTDASVNISRLAADYCNKNLKSTTFKVFFDCVVDDPPVDGVPPISITCAVTANVTIANRAQLTSNLVEPYTFNTGVLLNIFGEQVNKYCVNQMALEDQANLRVTLKSNWFPVAVSVSNRFVNKMGADLMSTDTRRFLARSIGLELQNIQGTLSLSSTTDPNWSMLSFSVSPKTGITYDIVISILTSQVNILQFPKSDGTVVPFWLPSDANYKNPSRRSLAAPAAMRPSVVQFTLVNDELLAALPFSDAQTNTYGQQIINIIAAKASLGTDVLDVVFEGRDPSSQTAVLITLIVQEGSDLLNQNVATMVSGWTFGSTASVGLTSAKLTYQTYLKNEFILAQHQLDLNVNATFNATLLATTTLSTLGASSTTLARGSYLWTDLNIAEDSSSLPFMTNAECKRFSDHTTNLTIFESDLKADLSKYLPLTPEGIFFLADVTCGPYNSLQNHGDQRAVFTVKAVFTALYTMFPQNANYVVLPVSADASYQLPEGAAPFSLLTVKSLLQNSLRRVFLMHLEAATNEEIDTLSKSIASSSSDSGAGLPLAIVAAAAGGGIVLIIVIVLIVRRKKDDKRSAPRKDKTDSRTVVAFENPMYASPSKPDAAEPTGYDENTNNASAGLYDEPAFQKQEEKDNPLYESTEDLSKANGYLNEDQFAMQKENTYGYDDNQPGFDAHADTQANLDDTGYLDVDEGNE